MGSCCDTTKTRVRNIEFFKIGSEEVTKENQIACGGHGTTWLCRSTTSTSRYALKQASLKLTSAHDIFDKQVEVMRSLTKLGLQGSIRLITADIHPRQSSGKVGRMLLQLGQETLLDAFNQRDFKQTEVLEILKDVSKSLKQLHSVGVTHFDIKPENIIRFDDSWKLCDFGSALREKVEFNRLSSSQKKKFKEYLRHHTTEIYSAPEMIDPEDKVIGTASDIWMLGCVAYILVYGRQPFSKASEITSQKLNYPFEGNLTGMIREMLSLDQKKRPSADSIYQRLQQKLVRSSSNMSTEDDGDQILQTLQH